MAQTVVELKADLKLQKEFWTNVFHDADKNKDGKVDIVELKMSLNNVRRKKGLEEFSDKEIASIFNDVDRDGSKRLEECEFVTEMLKPKRRDAFAKCFRDLDKDQNGKLSLTEVKSLYAELDLTDEEIQKALKPVDVDNDGFISFEEFMKCV